MTSEIGIGFSIATNLIGIGDKKRVSEEQFKRIRSYIKANRRSIRTILQAKEAAGRSVGKLVAPTYLKTSKNIPLYFRDGWISDGPLEIKYLYVDFVDEKEPSISVNVHDLPYFGTRRFDKYSDAVNEFDKPQKYDDNPQYRLMDIQRNRLAFSKKNTHIIISRILGSIYFMTLCTLLWTSTIIDVICFLDLNLLKTTSY